MNPPGLHILNTGHGHMEVNFDNGDPVELERARRIITDMLKRGYLLFIEGADGVLIKVEGFDEKTSRYIIGDGALHPASEPLESEPGLPEGATQEVEAKTPQVFLQRRAGGGRKPKSAVPMAKATATAMGPIAGG